MGSVMAKMVRDWVAIILGDQNLFLAVIPDAMAYNAIDAIRINIHSTQDGMRTCFRERGFANTYGSCV